jgi:soluble lytic murein transglycosylase
MRRAATTDHAPGGLGAVGGPGPGSPGAGASPRRRRRRRIALLVVALCALGALGVAWYQVHQAMPSWYARLWYPLEYEQAIREEAARNDLDPALVAAMIDTESGFVPDSRSAQGAVGLMQLLPETARFVSQLPGRPSPPPDPLEDPAVNIAYGTRYLRYLIDRHGTVDLALAAYNGGEANLQEWLDEAQARGEELRIPQDIPFAETRGFVARVQEAVPIYRRAYGERLFSPSRERAPAQ